MPSRAEPAARELTETPAVVPRFTPAIATVLALQQSVGNAALSRRIARFTGGVATPAFSGSKSRPMLKRGSTDLHVLELQTLAGVPATGTVDDAPQSVIAFRHAIRHQHARPTRGRAPPTEEEQDVVVVEYGPAVLPEPPDAQLGPPESIVGQWHVYASRGLAFDIRRDGVVAFAPALTERLLTRPPGL